MASVTIHCIFLNVVNGRDKITAYVNHTLIFLIVNGVICEQQTVCLLKLHYEVSYLETVGRGGHWGEVCHSVRDRSSAAVQHTCLCEWGGRERNGVCWSSEESV